MHIVIGLIAGIALGAVAASAAVQLGSPASLTVPASKVPPIDAPAVRSWDV